jgi:hypothetical protein
MNLELSLEQDIQVLSKYRLTCLELIFIKLIRESCNSGNTLYLETFLTDYVNDINVKSIVESLVEKKVLVKEALKISTKDLLLKYPCNLVFNKNFNKAYLLDAYELFEEFREHYPFNVYINGSPVDLRLINSKEYKNESEVASLYCKIIKYDLQLHKEILKALDYGVQNNLICTNIITFIISRGWERIIRIMNGEDTNLQFDNVTML